MIGQRLQDLRIDSNLSQDELGKAIGVTGRMISGYERDENEPPDEIKVRLSKYFNVSVDFLIGISDNPAIAVDCHDKKAVLYFEHPLSDEARAELETFRDYINFKYRK